MNQRNEWESICQRTEHLDPFYQAVWKKAYAEAIPITGTFELTCRCNFSCRMCYVHLKPDQMAGQGRELTAKEWIRTAEEAKKAGTTWLCITGGEPLMHPEFESIWRELSQMGFFITLQTNGSLINERMAKLLEEYPPRRVKLTLYGSGDSVYEEVCRVKEGFGRVDAGIRTLKELKIPISLVGTIIRQNEAGVNGIAAYAYRNRLPLTLTRNIKASARGADSQAREVRIPEENNWEIQREKLQKRLREAPMKEDRKPCSYCRDYRVGYWITWNGDMRFCSFMEEPHISVRERTFQKAWEELIEYEENLDWPKECKSCEVRGACYRCAGLLAAECGGPEQVTEEFCQRVKKYLKE